MTKTASITAMAVLIFADLSISFTFLAITFAAVPPVYILIHLLLRVNPVQKK